MNIGTGRPVRPIFHDRKAPLWRVLKWIAIIFGVLILIIVLFLAFFDLNRLRGPISAMVSDRVGRPFTIRGDLDVDWSWTPKLTINDIELDNASWGSRPEMFTLDRAEVSLRIPDLFKGRLVVPEVRISKPRLLLEKNAAGKANWDFGAAPKKEEKEKEPTGLPISRRWFPKIDRLAIDDGRFVFRDPQSATELDMNVSTVVGASNEQALELSGRGRLQKEQFKLTARGGSILTLWEKGKPFPIDVKTVYGDTEAKIKGTIAEPLQLEGPNLRFEAQGPDLAVLRPFTKVWIPATPPYRFAGRIERRGERWLIKGFEGKLGGSDLSGDLMFTMRDERPYLEGDLFSKKLDFRDFAGFIGANPKPDAPPRPRLLPDQPYDLEGLRVADTDIRFRSDNIVTPKMPVDEVFTHVRLDHGVLTLKPANATVGLGRIESNITLDATGKKILTKVDTKIDKVPFQRLVSKTPFADETAGTFFGRVEIATAGNSVAEMAAGADGGITVLMEDGRISGLMMELAGVDVVEALGIALTGEDPSLPVRCTIADFIVSDGVVKTKLFLMDTTDTNLVADGTINLHNEAIDLRLAARPKDISLFSARTPVIVGGTLKKPAPRPEATPLVAKGAASVALGALLTPAAAILPWVELGLEKDSPCRALVDAAEKKEGLGKPTSKKSKRPNP
jgi:uncharacterized protein involved in outer membrane biogenesis